MRGDHDRGRSRLADRCRPARRAGRRSSGISRSTARVTVTLADDVAISTRPYFSRNGLQESRYTLSDPSQFGKPASHAAAARRRRATSSMACRSRFARPSSGAKRSCRTAMCCARCGACRGIAVTITPANAIVPIGERPTKSGVYGLDLEVTVAAQRRELPTSGQVTLRLPAGWKAEPASQPFSFARSGERVVVSIHRDARRRSIAKPYQIEAVATDGRQGISRRLRADRSSRSRGALPLSPVDDASARRRTSRRSPGLKVGYVMGVGDPVPQGLQQLGAQVTLLGERELASADLSRLRHDHDRHARVCGARRSQDLQLAAARLRRRPAAT